MASFFITTTARDTPSYPWAHANYLRIVKAAEISVGNGNSLANHPRDADVIVFVESGTRFQSDITLSPLFRNYSAKSVVLDFADNPFPVVPGLYVGLSQKFSSEQEFESGFYIRVATNQIFLPFEDAPPSPDLLFSFMGRTNNYPSTRQQIMALKHSRALILDQSSNQADNDSNYVRTLYRSKFVLAPRGYGPSSWRLFESMRAGRVPVIISDDWVPPTGIAWPDISVRVAERDIHDIPDLLESLETRSASMGAVARSEWERCFSLNHGFEWIASRLVGIVANRARMKASLLGILQKAPTSKARIQFLVERIAVRLALSLNN